MKLWYIYIMSNKYKGVIYIGVTYNLLERVKEHKLKIYPNSFTAKYNCDKLINFEEWENGFEATKREKQLKKWKRDWKVNLIGDMNPTWMDISLNWNFDFNKIRNRV